MEARAQAVVVAQRAERPEEQAAALSPAPQNEVVKAALLKVEAGGAALEAPGSLILRPRPLAAGLPLSAISSAV